MFGCRDRTVAFMEAKQGEQASSGDLLNSGEKKKGHFAVPEVPGISAGWPLHEKAHIKLLYWCSSLTTNLSTRRCCCICSCFLAGEQAFCGKPLLFIL